MTERARRALEIACVVAVGSALAVAYGSQYGRSNQTTYLLDPLVRAFPELYQRDWFVAQMHHYHVAFGYFTAPLYRLDPDGPIAFGIAQLVTMVATFGAIYALISAVTTRQRLVIFTGIVGLLALGGGRALGGTYLYAGYLQPSSLASLAWLIAMIAWIRERRLAAGIALAVGGIFHLNFAVLGIGVFGLAELCSRQTNPKRLAMVLAPSFMVVAVFLPMLLGSSRTSDPEFALHVLVRFAFPIHFRPRRVGYELPALLGWLSIAWAMRPVVDSAALARLRWFSMCCLGCCLAALCLAAIPPVLTLTRLFAWRAAPFGQLAAQLIFVLAVMAIARGDMPRPRGWPLAALLFGGAAVVFNACWQPRTPYPTAIAIAMVGCVVAVVLRREVVVRALCIIACVAALWFGRATLRSPIVFRSPETDVMKWARTTAPVDAVFVVPPYATDFRLLSRRAIIVDTKSPPMYLTELVEWYRRLCTLVDAQKLDRLGDAWARWDALPAGRLLAIAGVFRADYILLWKDRSTARLSLPVAYEDPGTIVYAVRP